MHQLPSSANNLAGKVETAIIGRTIDFKRTISPGAAFPGSRFMPASNFRDHHLVYIIHLPLAAKESNATRTENNGKTLVWDFPLDQAIQKPVTTHFVAPIPIPHWVLTTTILGFLLLAASIFYILRKHLSLSLL